MTTQATTSSWIAKIVRICMVFILVFGTSFQVEMALAVDYSKDKINQHDGDVPEKLTAYQLSPIEGKDEDKWDSIKENDNIEIGPGEKALFSAQVAWDKTTDKDGVPTYIEWEWDGKFSTDDWFYEVENDLKEGAADETHTITVQLNEDAATMASGDNLAVTFKVTLKAPAAPSPEISGLAVSQVGGGAVADGDTVDVGSADSASFTAGLSWAGEAGGAASDLVAWTVAGNGVAGDACDVTKDSADADGNVAVTCALNEAGSAMAASGVGSVSFLVHFETGSGEDAGFADKLANHKDSEKLTGLEVHEVSGEVVGDVVQNGGTITVSSGRALEFGAVPSWDGKQLSEKIAGDYVTWTVDGKAGQVTDGVLKVSDQSDGKGMKAQVVCNVADSAKGRADGSVSAVAFTVEFEKAETPMGLEIKITGKDLKSDDTSFTITREKGAQFSDYQFIGTVRAYDDNTKADLFTYTSDEKGASLAQVSGGRLTDLKWQLIDSSTKEELDKKLAEIDAQKGLLKVHENCEFIVRCSTTNKTGEQTASAELTVICKTDGEAPPSSGPDQGSPLYRQDSLHVTANVAVDAVSEDAAIATSSSSSASKNKSSSSSSSSATDNENASSSSSESEQSKGVQLEKTYSPADIEALSSAESTYSMKTSAGKVTVTGVGPTLQALFSELGIKNMDAVYEVTFVDYAEEKTTVTWSEFESASPVVTTKSYVHGSESGKAKSSSSSNASESQSSATSTQVKTQAEGDDEDKSSSAASSSSNASSSASDDEFYDYTRFRILYDGSAKAAAAIDADSLRYIKEIQINPGKEIEPVPNPEAPFTVKVDYAPAPLGFEAVFSPVVSKEIAGATFDFVWEESSDKGKTWKKVGTNQTLKLKMTEKRVGHLIRVTVNSDMVDKETGEKYNATSEPVEIVLADGFSVQLEYDPPVAGGVAIFQAIIIDLNNDVDESKLDYIWEMSEDGGKTWTKLPKKYQGKPTLKIQTDPIDESDDSVSDADPNLIYIHVKAVETTGQKRVRVSNMQALTVHVGDEKGTGDDSKNSGLPGPQAQLVDDSLFTNPDSKQTGAKDAYDQHASSKSSDSKTPVADEEEPDEVEPDEVEPDEVEPDDAVPNDTPSNQSQEPKASDSPEIHINEAVTQQILEQQEAVQEHIESTVPGARWTSLSPTRASSDDARNVLSDNPFAPLAIPTGMGITAAGAVEKLLAFRRQLR